MPLVYLDTSAFLRRFKTESGSVGIGQLFSLAEGQPGLTLVLVTSGWTLNESTGVLLCEHHKGHLTKQQMYKCTTRSRKS